MYKKVYRILCMLLFLIPASAFCQQAIPIDSLFNAADNEKADTARMKIYNTIANYYLDNNAGKAIEYLEKAKEIATNHKLALNIANNYYSLGYAYLVKADYDKSLYNYQQSTFIYEQLKDSFRLSNALLSIGNVYFDNKNAEKTNDYYDKAGAIIIALNDTSQVCNYYDTRGITYDQLGKYDSALKYLNKAYSLALKANLVSNAMNTLSNIGLSYKHINQTQKAINCFDTVLQYYKKVNTPPDMYASLYNNIGAAYSQANNFDKAIAAFTSSINLATQAGSTSIVMENYRNLSDMYGNMKNYEQQTVYLKKYYHLKDSIFTIDKSNQLTELESDYRIEKKNAELTKKEAEVTKQKSQRNFLLIIASSIFAVMLGFAFFYTRIRAKNKLLQQQNVQISNQKNELLTLNHVKDRLFSIISHDLRNPLVTLRSYLTLADNESISAEKKQMFKAQTMYAVSQTGDMLDNLLAWANMQIKNTRPAIIPVNVQDLVADAISSVKPQALQKQIEIEQQIFAETILGDYNILMIALRNLLTNAIKFSAEKKIVFIGSKKVNDRIYLSVKDEGIGLTEEQVIAINTNDSNSTNGTKGEKGSGLGLFLIKELLKNINASLLIESVPGTGSTFIISLPTR